MGRVCKFAGKKRGMVGPGIEHTQLEGKKITLSLNTLHFFCVCMLQEIQCAKLLSLTTVKLIFLGNHPSVGA